MSPRFLSRTSKLNELHDGNWILWERARACSEHCGKEIGSESFPAGFVKGRVSMRDANHGLSMLQVHKFDSQRSSSLSDRK